MENILLISAFSDTQKAELQALVPSWPIVFGSYASVTSDMVSKANIIIGNVPVPLLASAQSLKWLQLYSSGSSQFSEALSDTIKLTCCTGAFGTTVSEHLLTIVLAVMKNIPLYNAAQTKSNWIKCVPHRMVEGSTVLVVGTGDIGSSFARKIQAMGATVLGCRRTASAPFSGFDAIYTTEELDDIIPRADIIALTLPETSATIHLFDARRLRLMKNNAIIANVGRGNAIDTEALCDVMQEGHLAAAALDVTEEEPLPPEHRLWKTPRVLITPHSAGGLISGYTVNLVFAICLENLRRYRDGKELTHKVNRETGYRERA